MKVSKVQCPNHYITITLIFAPSIFALPIFGGPNVRKNRGFGVLKLMYQKKFLFYGTLKCIFKDILRGILKGI